MSTRTPKLDPKWMEALGFRLIDNTRIATLQWRNDKLDLQVGDNYSIANVADRYRFAVEHAVIKRQQLALREVLLPAMGLEIHNEYDNYGNSERTYIRTE